MSEKNGTTTVPVPVVLNLRQDRFEAFKAILAERNELGPVNEREVLSGLLDFAIQAYTQLPAEMRKGSLEDALANRLTIHEAITHRMGLILSETERLVLLHEALVIEARSITSQAAPAPTGRSKR